MSLLNNHINEIPKFPLYHYTTQAGFMGIIESNSIWLTHYRCLNDTAEYKYGVDLALAELAKRTARKGIDDMHSFLGHRFMAMYREVFVASFSCAKDSLSQWRAYGSQTGYSIGFEGRAFSKLAEKHGVYLCKCSYDKNEHRHLINEVLDRWEEDKKNGSFSPMGSSEIEELFLKTFCVIKPPAFRDEEEWRLIYSPKNHFVGESIEESDMRVFYRSGESFIVPFVKLEFSRYDFCHALHNIYLGPNKYMDEALSTAKKYIENNMKPDRHLLPGVLSTSSTYRDC